MTLLYPYQADDANRGAFEFKGRVLYGHEPGLGKSLMALTTAKLLEAKPIVIVCPAVMKWVWQVECMKHFGWKSTVLSGMTFQKQKVKPIIILNYRILPTWLGALRRLKPKMVIIDEAHELKNRRTQQTNYTTMLCEGVPYVLALTGTPIENGVAEFWPLLNILQPGKWSSFWKFAAKYTARKKRYVTVKRGDKQVTHCFWDHGGSSNLEELNHRLKSVMIRRKKSEVLSQLPPKRRSIVPLELPDRSEYDLAEADFRTWLMENAPDKMTSSLRNATLTKLGYLKRIVGRLKLPLVKDWINAFLNGSDEKLVVFTMHRDVIDDLHLRYVDKSVKIDGSVPELQRQKALEVFQGSKEIRLFFGNLKAAGTGLTLTAASTMLFAELAWNPATHLQGEDRIHRIGQANSVNIYYTIARNTVEERIIKLLKRKQRTISAVVDGKANREFDLVQELTKDFRKDQQCKTKKSGPYLPGFKT